MSKTDDTFEPAFPIEFVEKGGEDDGMQVVSFGLSIRDYFAAKAMAGVIIAHPDWGKEPKVDKRIALISYSLADAMLHEREK